eukprot:4702929-Amphidinium_carterae.1
MAQTPNQPTDVVSVPSSTVGPNTQDTLPYQQQIENYSGPSLVHGNARSVHEDGKEGKTPKNKDGKGKKTT